MDKDEHIKAAQERLVDRRDPAILTVDQMEERGIYRITARNFFVGAWDGVGGFIGIREKFGDEYLFTEYHYDVSRHVGTARPWEKVGEVPDGVEIAQRLDDGKPNTQLYDVLAPYVRAENERFNREGN